MTTTSIEIARQMAGDHNVALAKESVHALADILVGRKYKKGEMVLNEGEVCTCMRYIEKGMLRQFYFKYGKDMTEHIAYEKGGGGLSGKLFPSGAYPSDDRSFGTDGAVGDRQGRHRPFINRICGYRGAVSEDFREFVDRIAGEGRHVAFRVCS